MSEEKIIPQQDPEEISKKDKMLITTIIFILMVVAAMAVAGFLFIRQGPDTVQGQGEATEIRRYM